MLKNWSSLVLPVLMLCGIAEATGPIGPAPIPMGTAGNFQILAGHSIKVTSLSGQFFLDSGGNFGLYQANASALSFVSPGTITKGGNGSFGTFNVGALGGGTLFAQDFNAPTPSLLSAAAADFKTAFTNGSGRTNPNFTNLASGRIGNLTLTPGLYKWTTNIVAATNFTISGGPADTWIFQTSLDLTVSPKVFVQTVGGADPKNIFWVVSGDVTVGIGAKFQGIILCRNDINLMGNATSGAVQSRFRGKALAMNSVSLNSAINDIFVF